MTRARQALAFTLAICILLPAARADDQLLGICSAISVSSCGVSNGWTVQETALTPSLNQPANANAAFQIVVTEGVPTGTLSLTDVVTLTGLIPTGTNVDSIALSVQKLDPTTGAYSTIASAVVGNVASSSCGCPFVPSSMQLTARDASGNVLSGTPLLSLAFGDTESVALEMSWGLGGGLVHPGDQLRLQPCVPYTPDASSQPAGCFLNGGNVRAVRACSTLEAGACAPTAAQLTETLSSLSNPIASLSSFTASTNSASLSPPSIVQTAGGPAVSFSATPTGNAGTVSLVDIQGQVSCTGIGLATMSGAASIAGASASASVDVDCLGNAWSCADLGAAAPYTVFLTHDISAAASDIEGALAAGGAVSLTNYGVGANLSAAQPLALVAGGDLNLSSAWVFGDALFGGTASLSSAGASGTLLKGSPIDFDSAAAQLASLSNQLAALPAPGSVNTSEAAGTVLSGADPTLDVFTLSAAELESSWGLSFSVPPSAFVVLNITGSTANFVNQAFSTGGLPPSQIIINLPRATALTLEGVGLQGTLLAPQAAVQFNNGVVEGAILASSLTGDGQSNLAPSPGCIPIPGSGGSTPACDLLGAASAFNLFVSGNYTASSGDVQGAAAAGGDVALSSYTIGALLPNQAGGPALVAGGNLELNVGGDVYGDAVYGGTSTIAGSFTITGSTRRGTPLDFADAFTALDSLSQQLNDLGVNGAIAAQYGNLTLTGTDPTLNVFQLPATALSGQWGITLEVPAGSFALINVAGTSVALEQTIALNGLPSTSLLFNLPQATSLQIENTDLSASVLAPLAAITFSSGRMEGTLVGASMSGDGQTNLPLLNPCFPVAVRAAAAGR